MSNNWSRSQNPHLPLRRTHRLLDLTPNVSASGMEGNNTFLRRKLGAA
jgi:hypothetical protein